MFSHFTSNSRNSGKVKEAIEMVKNKLKKKKPAKQLQEDSNTTNSSIEVQNITESYGADLREPLLESQFTTHTNQHN